jgi:hypothetical protein
VNISSYIKFCNKNVNLLSCAHRHRITKKQLYGKMEADPLQVVSFATLNSVFLLNLIYDSGALFKMERR